MHPTNTQERLLGVSLTGIMDSRLMSGQLGMDALQLVHTTPSLMPQAQADRFALFAPAKVFLNASARQRLGSDTVRLQSGS